MSRNLSVQLSIMGLLIVLVVTIIIQLMQFNNLEKNIIETRQRVERLEELSTEIKTKLDQGVVAQTPVASNDGGGQAASNDAGNLLTPDPTKLMSAGAKPGGELQLTTRSDFKGFNQLVENSTDVQQVYSLFIGGYLSRRHYKDPEKWHTDLAMSIVPNSDFTTYHVKLRKGVKWHRPAVDFANARYKWLDKEHEVVADDFAFTLEMILDEKVEGAAPARSYFEHFDKIEVINDHEFKVHWKKAVYSSKSTTMTLWPTPRWLYGADEDGQPYPKEIVGLKMNNHWYNDRGIGTGPYRFVESRPGEFLRLTRNDRYYGGRAPIKDIVYKIVRDANAQFLMFKKGEVDIMSMSATQYRKEILEGDDNSPFKTGKFKHDIIPRLAYRYLGWNAKSALFEDKRVRRAMTHAFNREKIIKEVFVGLGKVVTGNFYIDTPWYDKSIKPLSFDLEQAKALMDEAGWKDSNGDGIRDKEIEGQKTDFEFTLLIYNNFPEIKSAADIFKEDLIKIGVKVNVLPVDWPAMQKRMEGKEFDAYTGGWGLGWEADPNQLWHSSQADAPKGSNFVSFKNEEADGIIEKAQETFDFPKRKELFNRFHQIVHEEQPYTFFMAPDSVIIYQSTLKNVTYQKPRPQILYQLMWKEQP